tara:strand:- start:1567 stop:2793 length:1227 start_codon:yes stop_codon:yes gene_type:complete
MMNRRCRITGDVVTNVLDFGRQPLGNGFLLPNNYKDEYFYQMSIGFCEQSFMMQLNEQPSPEKMFHEDYAFYSSTSRYMGDHFEEFANYLLQSEYLSNKDPFVVELGCNDGIFLKHIASKNINHLGIEPSLNVATSANLNGVETISEFFGIDLARKILKKYGQVDAFIAANVMCHISDINGVVKGISELIKPEGVIIFEDPYLGDVIRKTSYDQIYDEHVFIFSGLSIQALFSNYGFELIDLLPQSTHGGSMRYVLAKKGVYLVKDSVSNILREEHNIGLDNIDTIRKFSEKVQKSKKDLVELLSFLKKQGKRVAGYGATSKSTTILNYCGIGPELIEYISDSTPIKQGKFSPGMHIPIYSHDKFVDNPPDYAVLFAWNHAKEIMEKETNFIANGGKWITHVPEVKIL